MVNAQAIALLQLNSKPKQALSRKRPSRQHEAWSLRRLGDFQLLESRVDGQAARRREATVRRLRRRYRRAASRIKGPARRGSGRQGGQRRRTWCCGRAWPRRAWRRPRSPRSAVTLTITLSYCTITLTIILHYHALILHYHAQHHAILSRSTAHAHQVRDERYGTVAA